MNTPCTIVTAALSGLLALSAIVATAQDFSSSSSSSYSYSGSFGNAAPMPPMPPMAPGPWQFGREFGTPHPGFFGPHFFPPAPFPGATSSVSSTIILQDVPFVSALSQIAHVTRTKVFVSSPAAEVLREIDRKVTLSERNQTSEELVAKVLEGSGLIVRSLDDDLYLLTEDEKVEDLEAAVEAREGKAAETEGLHPLAWIQTDRALEEPMTLVMLQTPAPFVIQMLESMIGMRIELPAEYQKHFYVPQPLVSVQAQGEPLRKVLESVAEQIECEVVVSDGTIALRQKKPPVSR